MKILKRILIVLVVLAALAAIVGMFLPSQVHVERSLTMNVKPAKVYAYVDNIRKYNEYSPWHQLDTTTQYTFEGPESGVGAKMTWDGKHWQVKKGSMNTIEVVPNEMIKRELYFMEDKKPAYGTFTFTPDGDGTKVAWILDADMGANPYKRIMGKMMGMVGDMFDKGLAMMKTRVESMPDPAEASYDFQMEVTNVAPAHYLAIRDTVSIPTIGEKLGKCYGIIGAAIGKQKLKMAGNAFAIFYTDSQTNWEMDAAMPVDKPGKADGDVKPGEMKAGKAVVARYFGSYEKMGSVYAGLKEYIAANNLKMTGAPWEEYVTTPMMEKDTSKWHTNVYFPIE